MNYRRGFWSDPIVNFECNSCREYTKIIKTKTDVKGVDTFD